MIKFDAKHPIYSLQYCFLIFNEIQNHQSKFQENSLIILEFQFLFIHVIFSPKLPEYDSDKVVIFMNFYKPKTLDGQIQTILSLHNNIEKLFTIYYYLLLHLRYDIDAFFSGNIQSPRFEALL